MIDSQHGEADHRDFQQGEDVSDRRKRTSLVEVLNQLKGAGWLKPEFEALDPNALLEQSLPLMQSTRLMNLIEFGRAVHAEMAAITDAARRGVSVQGCTCLRCLYPPDAGPSADMIAARASGLTLERVRDADDVVRDEDVEHAPPDKREGLRAQLGVKICSVIRGAVLAAISDGEHAEGFEPSVPFVATMSGAMVVGEAVKVMAGFQRPLEPRFQFNVLTGPALGLDFPEARCWSCQCTTRRAVIEQLRRARAGNSR